MNKNFIENYFSSRNLQLSLDNDRNVLANREIATLKFLIKEFFNEKLNTNLNILDLGSGDEFLKKPLESENNKYFSLDIEDLNFEKDEFKFENEKFDLIICLAVIEHIQDPSIFMNEIFRVLKKNGYLFMSTPNWKYCKNEFYNDPTHKKPYTPISLKSILDMQGYSITKTFPNLRCKSRWWYSGNLRFFKARYLIPFSKKINFLPDFLFGKSKGIFSLSKK